VKTKVFDIETSVLTECTNAFVLLSKKVPEPKLVPFGNSFVFRHVEKTLEQAIVQKLSRVISTTQGIKALMHCGLYQEVGVLFRVLDELAEDTFFLCLPLLGEPRTANHEKYLTYFYMEDHKDPENLTAEFKKRPTVPRSTIHAAIASAMPINQHDGIHVHQVIGTLYSGFIHASSPHIMDSYGGAPPHFHLSGMKGTPREATFQREATTYYYRALQATMLVALAFKDDSLSDRLYEFRASFELHTGMTEWKDPESMMRKLKAKAKRK
jgi:hypothetical protein